MAPKGTSVIMYSDKKYLHCQYSVAPDWPGGLYITPTISGELSEYHFVPLNNQSIIRHGNNKNHLILLE